MKLITPFEVAVNVPVIAPLRAVPPVPNVPLAALNVKLPAVMFDVLSVMFPVFEVSEIAELDAFNVPTAKLPPVSVKFNAVPNVPEELSTGVPAVLYVILLVVPPISIVSALVVLFLFTLTVTDDGVLVSSTYTPAFAALVVTDNPPVDATCNSEALVPKPFVPAADNVTLPAPALIVPLPYVMLPLPVAASVMLPPLEAIAPTA